MIVRVSHDRENPYFCMNKHSANNKALSFKALGIHAYLMSKPDNWRANEMQLADAHHEGMAAIRSGIKELIEHGYISRTRVIDKETKRVVGWEWTVYETPSANPDYKPGFENRNVEPDCENRKVEQKPHCDFPLLENPRVENRTLISNEEINNTASANVPAAPKTKKPSASQARRTSSDESNKPTGGEVKKPSEHQQMFEKVCEIVGWDYKTIGKTTAGQVAQALGILKDAGYTLEDLNRFVPEVWVKDWRWEKHQQRPSLMQVREEIGKLRAKNLQTKATGSATWSKAFNDDDTPDYIKQMQAGK
jgi:hypothetical protein